MIIKVLFSVKMPFDIIKRFLAENAMKFVPQEGNVIIPGYICCMKRAIGRLYTR